MTSRGETTSGPALLVSLAAIPFLAALNGWVIKTAWNWFIPDVTGWTRLGILQAIGIGIVISIAWPRRCRSREERGQTFAETWEEILTHAATMLLTLGIGFIVHAMLT